MQLPVLIPRSDAQLSRPTILLLSDDLNAPSGIGTMSREFVFKTADRFNWIQIASSVQHPDVGKILDISKAVEEETGLTDVSIKLYPYSGYGDAKILEYILNTEKVDAILHFTDPRYWTWLYALEHEIRAIRKIPIMYYSIWDDLPFPNWNLNSYSSCDLLMAINKQTHIIHQEVLKNGGYDSIDLRKVALKDVKKTHDNVLLQYIPHGIDSKKFKPLTEADPEYPEYLQFVESFNAQNNSPEFIIFWNNRNIRRKQPGDVILAYKMFCDSLPPEEAAKCVLFLHTHPRDPNGTDLIAVRDNICPMYNIIFSVDRVNTKVLNFYYNISDVTLNIASNEGFGLSSAESIMAGTPVINNVTGGLQDQMGFRDHKNKEYFPDAEMPTNHTGLLDVYGDWAYAVIPSNRSLQGSLETPYIFDDRARLEDVADGMDYWYDLSKTTRKEYGLAGRKWMIEVAKMEANDMANKMAESMELCMKTFVPKPKAEMVKITPKKQINKIGIV